MKHPILGILGGLGPASGAYFYDMLIAHTQAACDADHIDVVLSGGASTPDRTGYILGNSEEDPLPAMLSGAHMLCDCGADFIAIPCNTAHFFYDAMSARIEVPIINIIRETVSYIQSMGVKKLGVLATEGTVASGAYRHICEQAGIECITPDEMDQATVSAIIYDQIKAGKPADLSAFSEICDRLCDRGCERLVLGCTELSLLRRDGGLEGELFVDSLEVLACASICACKKTPIGFSDSLINFEEKRRCSYQHS